MWFAPFLFFFLHRRYKTWDATSRAGMPDKDQDAGETQLRGEVTRRAQAGRGEEMERHHLPIVLPVLELMDLQSDDNVLDIGCGSGWLSRLIAERVREGRVVGIDVSDEMVRRARKRCVEHGQVMFVLGSVEEIPWDNSFFTKAISVESAYYWPQPAQGVRSEERRVGKECRSRWSPYH